MEPKNPSKVQQWITKKSEILYSTSFFKLRKDTVYMPHRDKEHPIFIADHHDWVNIIAITEDNNVVFTRQYRHGIQQVCLEIPGGMVESIDKNPIDAAKRELLEETGYTGDDIQYLGKITPNPAFNTNHVHPYLFKNVQKVAGQNLDPTEEIEILLIPLKDIPELIKKGEINHLFSIGSFYLAQLYL